jgi:hypothetical protein
MKPINLTFTVFFITLLIAGTVTGFTQQGKPDGREKNYESLFNSLSKKVDTERIRKGVFYLSKDPLPRRVLNWSLPGHNLSTLEEADAWLIQQLTKNGYKPSTDETRVRAFGRDFSKPPAHQYSRPPDDAPWYTARNIIAEKLGKKYPDDLIIIIAHKDSQSWIASPGANDNAVGTCGALELARVLKKYKPEHTIRFIFCNEEHTPWTSVTAANAIKESKRNVLALINMDGIGVKSPQQAGKMTNVTRYTTPEGEKLANLMSLLNERHSLGLEQSKFLSPRPGDDDGSFINAGFPWSVLNIGSMPYADPNYHLETDTPDKTDVANAALTVRLTLAAILHLDAFGRP